MTHMMVHFSKDPRLYLECLLPSQLQQCYLRPKGENKVNQQSMKRNCAGILGESRKVDGCERRKVLLFSVRFEEGDNTENCNFQHFNGIKFLQETIGNPGSILATATNLSILKLQTTRGA